MQPMPTPTKLTIGRANGMLSNLFDVWIDVVSAGGGVRRANLGART